jgi:hypothetical protein
MKVFYFKLVACLLFVLPTACKHQESPDPGFTSVGSINITASTDDPETKTTLSGLESHWEAGTDKIGIFSTQARTTQDGTPPANNVAFTAQNSAKSAAFSGTLYWGAASTEHTFYAYYPYDAGYARNQTAVPVSLSSAQFQSQAGDTDHVGALDFMVASPVTVTSPAEAGAIAESVNLTFHHLFALIEFQITGSGQLTQVSLTGADPLAFGSGTLDLTQSPGATSYTITKSGTSNHVTITLGTPITLTGTPVSIFMMVLPGAQSGNMKIALKTGGTWKEMSKAPPAGGFARGQKYVVELSETTLAANFNIYIPDANFKSYCVTNFDSNHDNEISVAEAEAVTEINVFGEMNIASLEGIQYFTALTTLNCSFNTITFLDVSNNLALSTLYCTSNGMERLITGNNTTLATMNCESNSLGSLDLSGNTGLTYLVCSRNDIRTLDLSNNTLLERVECKINNINTIHISNHPDLWYLDCTDNLLDVLDISGSPDLRYLYACTNSLDLHLYLNPALNPWTSYAWSGICLPPGVIVEYK